MTDCCFKPDGGSIWLNHFKGGYSRQQEKGHALKQFIAHCLVKMHLIKKNQKTSYVWCCKFLNAKSNPKKENALSIE